MPTYEIKNHVKHFLLQQANYQRIHIVGCARSGTTLFYYLMMAYENTILFNKEVSVWNWPSLRDVIGLIAQRKKIKPPMYIVTKRNASWWHPEKLERLIYFVRHFKISIIHVVRDPRDVLTSVHKNKPGQYYVTFETWRRSIEAGERLLQEVSADVPTLVVRYEDIVQNIRKIEAVLFSLFHLRYKPGVTSLANLSDFVDEEARQFGMVHYMNTLRNVDARSLKKWQSDPQRKEYLLNILKNAEFRNIIGTFMHTYGYSWDMLETEENSYG